MPQTSSLLGPVAKDLGLIRRGGLNLLGLGLILTVLALSGLAPLIAPYGPEERIREHAHQSPSLTHLLGTDEDGGDIFSRILWAMRLDLGIASFVVVSAVAIGAAVGTISGFIGGRVDELFMRVTDVFLALPGLILAMSIAALLGRNLTNLILALVAVWWTSYARLVRGQVIVEKEKPYVEAVRSIGASRARIMLRHILPNSFHPIMVSATLDFGTVILTASALSFIGFGVQPGAAELGRMIADGRNYLFQSPWIVAFPGLAILMVALGFNLVGDSLRDILDPRMRR